MSQWHVGLTSVLEKRLGTKTKAADLGVPRFRSNPSDPSLPEEPTAESGLPEGHGTSTVTVDQQLKQQLRHYRKKGHLNNHEHMGLLAAIYRAGEEGSGELVNVLLPLLTHEEQNVALTTADALIMMAGRGQEASQEALVRIILPHAPGFVRNHCEQAMVTNRALLEALESKVPESMVTRDKLLKARDIPGHVRLRSQSPAYASSLLGQARQTIIDRQIREALQGASTPAQRAPIFQRASDEASDALTPDILPWALDPNLTPEQRFDAVDAIVEMAARGEPRALEAFVEVFMDASLSDVRGYALQVYPEADIQSQLRRLRENVLSAHTPNEPFSAGSDVQAYREQQFRQQQAFASSLAGRAAQIYLDHSIKQRLKPDQPKATLLDTIQQAFEEGTFRVVPALRTLVDNPDPDVALSASNALVGMAQNGMPQALAVVVGDLMNHGLTSSAASPASPGIRALALYSLLTSETRALVVEQGLVSSLNANLATPAISEPSHESDDRLLLEQGIRQVLAHLEQPVLGETAPMQKHLVTLLKKGPQLNPSSSGLLQPLDRSLLKALAAKPEGAAQLIDLLASSTPDKFEAVGYAACTERTLMGLLMDQRILAGIKASPDLSNRLKTVLNQGMMHPKPEVVLPTKAGNVTVSHYLDPEDRFSNLYRQALLARLEGKSVKALFDESVIKDLQPLTQLQLLDEPPEKLLAEWFQVFQEDGYFNADDDDVYLQTASSQLQQALGDANAVVPTLERLRALSKDGFGGLEKAADEDTHLKPFRIPRSAMDSGWNIELYQQAREAQVTLHRESQYALTRGTLMRPTMANALYVKALTLLRTQGSQLLQSVSPKAAGVTDAQLPALQAVLFAPDILPLGDTDWSQAYQAYKAEQMAAAALIAEIGIRKNEDGRLANPKSFEQLVALTHYESPGFQKLDKMFQSRMLDWAHQLTVPPLTNQALKRLHKLNVIADFANVDYRQRLPEERRQDFEASLQVFQTYPQFQVIPPKELISLLETGFTLPIGLVSDQKGLKRLLQLRRHLEALPSLPASQHRRVERQVSRLVTELKSRFNPEEHLAQRALLDRLHQGVTYFLQQTDRVTVPDSPSSRIRALAIEALAKADLAMVTAPVHKRLVRQHIFDAAKEVRTGKRTHDPKTLGNLASLMTQLGISPEKKLSVAKLWLQWMRKRPELANLSTMHEAIKALALSSEQRQLLRTDLERQESVTPQWLQKPGYAEAKSLLLNASLN